MLEECQEEEDDKEGEREGVQFANAVNAEWGRLQPNQCLWP